MHETVAGREPLEHQLDQLTRDTLRDVDGGIREVCRLARAAADYPGGDDGLGFRNDLGEKIEELRARFETALEKAVALGTEFEANASPGQKELEI